MNFTQPAYHWDDPSGSSLVAYLDHKCVWAINMYLCIGSVAERSCGTGIRLDPLTWKPNLELQEIILESFLEPHEMA